MVGRNDFCRYEKQITVPEIGVSGQKRLRGAKVLVIGCGGLGSTVIPLMAASGVGKLVLCDDDSVKVSNLNRQTIYREQEVGSSKVLLAKEFVNLLNSDVEVCAVNVRLGPGNFEELFDGVDIVIDCVDRLAVKMLLNDACVLLKKALVHSAAIGFIGQILTIPPGGKPCLRCFFEGQQISTKLNCASAGILGPTVGVIGGIAAAEALKYLVGVSTCLVGKLQRVDLHHNRFATYKFDANSSCVACGEYVTVDPYDVESYEGKLYL